MRLHHANLRVSDPQKSLDFYRAMGLDVVGVMQMPGMYTVYLGGPDGDAVVEFTVREAFDESWSVAPGTGHLAFTTSDLDTKIAELQAAGIEPESPAYHPGGRDEAYVAFFVDPDGNRVELLHGEFPPPGDDLPDGLR